MHTVALSLAGGEPVEVAIEQQDARDREHHRARIGPNVTDVRIHWQGSGGVMLLRGRVAPFRAAVADEVIHVWLPGRALRFEQVRRTPQRAAAAAAAAGAGDLTAPMPGTVLKIHVKPGEAFEAHQPLIIMESMKMEMALSSPAAGTVREIRCKVGQLVELGALLVKLEAGE